MFALQSLVTSVFGSTGMGSGKADTAVDTRSFGDPGEITLHSKNLYYKITKWWLKLLIIVLSFLLFPNPLDL